MLRLIADVFVYLLTCIVVFLFIVRSLLLLAAVWCWLSSIVVAVCCSLYARVRCCPLLLHVVAWCWLLLFVVVVLVLLCVVGDCCCMLLLCVFVVCGCLLSLLVDAVCCCRVLLLAAVVAVGCRWGWLLFVVWRVFVR